MRSGSSGLLLTALSLSLAAGACVGDIEGGPDDTDLEALSAEHLEVEGYTLPGPANDDVLVEDLSESTSPRIERADLPKDVQEYLDSVAIEKVTFTHSSRVVVANTNNAPYRSVTKVLIQWKQNQQAKGCTGTLIATDAVLTNAHCIYNRQLSENGLPYRIQVIPGAYDKNGDFGEVSGRAWVGKTYASWTKYQQLEGDPWGRIPYDYAVLRLQTAFEKASVLPYATHPRPLDAQVLLVGYHNDLRGGRAQYTSKDIVRRVYLNGQFLYRASATEQSSGAPIWSSGDWAGKLFGLNSTELVHPDPNQTFNIGTLLSASVVKDINAWKVIKWR